MTLSSQRLLPCRRSNLCIRHFLKASHRLHKSGIPVLIRIIASWLVPLLVQIVRIPYQGQDHTMLPFQKGDSSGNAISLYSISLALFMSRKAVFRFPSLSPTAALLCTIAILYLLITVVSFPIYSTLVTSQAN